MLTLHGAVAGVGLARLLIPVLIPAQVAVVPMTVVHSVSRLLWIAVVANAIAVLAVAARAVVRDGPPGQPRTVVAP
ncbi:MAG: hypothetical protein J2P27_00020 [Actinobacteria bacterium]|nr:hypothetical protein [Actinomycetota bacterium]